MYNNFNFIMVTFPGGEKSIMRMGVFREIFDKEINNVVVTDYSIWSMNYKQQAKLISSLMRKNCCNIVIFIPGAGLLKYIPKKTVLELKESAQVPDLILCYLMDGIERMAYNHHISINECQNQLKDFDAVYTYDIYESQKYGYIFEPLPLKKFTMINQKNEMKTKLFFCGRSKGRIQMLQEIAALCEEKNILYEFLVLYDNETMGMKDEGGIHFIQYIKYDLLVEKMGEVTCLISLPADRNHMMPASYNEAIMYNKKLITNCSFLKNILYYDKRYMKSFDEVKNIDFEWICNGEKVDYQYGGQFSARNFLNHIASDYERGLLKQCRALNDMIRESGSHVCKIGIHYARKGWIKDIENAAMVRIPHQVEAIRLYNLPNDLKITLKVISKKSGFNEGINEEGYVECGTVGKSDPILSFAILLKPDSSYLLYYRAYVSNIGWTQLCSAGEWCGISNRGKDLVIEGVQIMIINKKLYHTANQENGIYKDFSGGGYKFVGNLIFITASAYRLYTERRCA